jgi:ATP-dependent DNA helicase RecG
MINNLIYRVTNNFDTLTASHHLRRLRDSGLLVQQGKGSATYYILNSQFLSTEKSEVDNFNLDSSTVKEETLSGQSSTPNLDSSTVKEETLSGQSSTPNLDSSTIKEETLSGQSSTPNLDSSKLTTEQLSLDLFPPTKKESLQDRLAKIGARTKPQEIKNLILEFCEIQPYSSNELASLLNRNKKYLLDEYLKPLIDDGLLEYTNPENPNDPHQTYRTVQK